MLPTEVVAFLACLHRVVNSNELRFLYSLMACFAIGAQVITTAFASAKRTVHHVSNESVYVGVTIFALSFLSEC